MKMRRLTSFRNSVIGFIFVLIFLFMVIITKLFHELSDDIVINEVMTICRENFKDTRKFIQGRLPRDYDNLTKIYFVTSTYPRPKQVPELLRLGQTLIHIPNIHWVIANDYDTCFPYFDEFLNKFGIPYTHIASPMPNVFRKNMYQKFLTVPSRRAALKWIRTLNITDGILYFGDSHNTYDIELFSELRDTKKVSMFPVGLIGTYAVQTPVVTTGKVIGFVNLWWFGYKEWPVSMSGFALNLEYLSRHPNATICYDKNNQEDKFLKSILLSIDDIEPKANNCTKILVWNMESKKTVVPTIMFKSQLLQPNASNLYQLYRILELMGICRVSETGGLDLDVAVFKKKHAQISNVISSGRWLNFNRFLLD